MPYHYQVIEAAEICKQAVVVPDLALGEGHFHVSAFKWVRAMPDRRDVSELGAMVDYDSDDSGDGDSDEAGPSGA